MRLFDLELNRRQAAIAAGSLAGVWLYFSLITGPNGEKLAELREALATRTQQVEQLATLKAKLSEIDKLTSQADNSQSIEARVERVGRELGVAPIIKKVGDGSITEPNKVEVTLPNLYLKNLIDFMKKIEQFPVTVQILKLEITKQQNVANIQLVLSDLNL